MVVAHMVRHVLLGAMAPALAWLIASRFPQPRRLARRTAFGTLAAHPATTWLAPAVAVIGWHVPAVFDLAQRSALWHGVQDASFFATGLLFWWPVIQPWQAAARLPPAAIPLYLFSATLPCDALSAFLVFCDRAVYGQSAGGLHHPTMSALADQEMAGAFMWVAITFIYLVPALVMTVRLLSPGYELPIRIPATNTSTPPTTT